MLRRRLQDRGAGRGGGRAPRVHSALRRLRGFRGGRPRRMLRGQVPPPPPRGRRGDDLEGGRGGGRPGGRDGLAFGRGRRPAGGDRGAERGTRRRRRGKHRDPEHERSCPATPPPADGDGCRVQTNGGRSEGAPAGQDARRRGCGRVRCGYREYVPGCPGRGWGKRCGLIGMYGGEGDGSGDGGSVGGGGGRDGGGGGRGDCSSAGG